MEVKVSRLRITLSIIVLVCGASSYAYGDVEKDSYDFNVKFGLSSFTGILGLEVKKGNYSVGIGFPGVVSFKYHLKDEGDTAFLGVFSGRFHNNEFNDYEDGLYFQEYERKVYGIAAGYSWRWESGWNVNTSLGLGKIKELFRNDRFYMTKEGNEYLPGLDSYFYGLNVGYEF